MSVDSRSLPSENLLVLVAQERLLMMWADLVKNSIDNGENLCDFFDADRLSEKIQDFLERVQDSTGENLCELQKEFCVLQGVLRYLKAMVDNKIDNGLDTERIRSFRVSLLQAAEYLGFGDHEILVAEALAYQACGGEIPDDMQDIFIPEEEGHLNGLKEIKQQISSTLEEVAQGSDG